MHCGYCAGRKLRNEKLNSSQYRDTKAVVKRFCRICISLVAFSAYAFGSNYCALAPAAPTVVKAPSHAGCPGHDSPAKGDKSDDMQCCKEFPPATVAVAKNLVAFDTFGFATQLYFTSAVFTAEQSRAELRPLELDTGPPLAASFAESVLQRSILAHAPPSLS